METKTVYLGLGTNLGHRNINLETVINKIAEIAEIGSQSSIYETDPVGHEDQEKFLNMVIEITTQLSPTELIVKLLEIEHTMGRIRDVKNGPRIIDIDILLYDKYIIVEEGLIIPHIHMHEREFVLRPLAEIAENVYHPTFKKTIKQLLDEL